MIIPVSDSSTDSLFLKFIDLPGLGEAHIDFHNFEDLVRTAAIEADTIVPIVSFKEAAKKDWRSQLPQIVEAMLKRSPDFVLCTHMDQAQSKKRIDEQLASVGKEFWPKITNFDRRVLRCSTRMGIGAQRLLKQSQVSKPPFHNIWKENTIIFDCVEKILGVGDMRQKYEQMDHKDWVKALEWQLRVSGLDDAISRLTEGIINDAQGHQLRLEGRKIMLATQKLASEQRRTLVEISRTRDESELAYNDFKAAQKKFEGFRSVCEDESKNLKNRVNEKLVQANAILEQNGQASAVTAVEAAAKRVEHHVSRSGFRARKTNEIIFNNKYEVENFFYTAQDEMARDAKNNLAKAYVRFVRELANRSKMQLFRILMAKLETVSKKRQAPPELVEDILDRLKYQTQDVDVLFYVSLKNRAVRTNVERHNIASAYTAIRNVLSKPFLRSSDSVDEADGTKSITSDGTETTDGPPTFSSDLGFMIRAPIAVLATIPLLLGSIVWPWLIHKKNFVIDKNILAKHFQEQMQKPYFIELRREAEKTMEAVINLTSQLAQDIVDSSLMEEQARFSREKAVKELSQSSVQDSISIAVDTVSAFWNLSAAEHGLNELQSKLNELLQMS
ncbi:hypothetical protein SCHPADRAFT_221994 [Schizopora paradoxa]|uniref:Uncharacterized protein n=1 Tax=Schizopora paradoxa TaxID=27342 RepID=A0A0H2S3G8_9AGAM|nr:hypothetical protein SCHPADRAFT_221994 [Schizopora paradoxa]